MGTETAGALLIVGSLTFLVGASIGVPQVFMEPEPQVKLQMIERHLTLWRVAQPLYVVGPVIASIGVGALAWSDAAPNGAGWLVTSSAILLVGTAFWAGDVFPRMIHHREFALGTLPGWPFVGYVWLTLLGLAAMGMGLQIGDFPAWMSWLTFGAVVGFAVFYVAARDIPPFFFYTLLLAIGIALL